MTKPKKPATNPASTLSPSAVEWRDRIALEFAITDGPGRLLLDEAAASWDRCQQAKALLARDGIVVTSPQGVKAHPAIAIERSARGAFLASLKALNLDIEPTRAHSGRPAWSNNK